MTSRIFARAASAATAAARRAPSLQRLRVGAAASRAYTRAETHTNAEPLSPVDMHKFLQARDRQHREFLDDEYDMLAESFLLDSGAAEVSPGKPVNSEFAQQIHALLSPDYGVENH